MTTRGTKGEYRCACCGNPFTARVADRNRGWARFCSKSCKATQGTGSAGWREDFLDYADTVHPFSSEAFEK